MRLALVVLGAAAVLAACGDDETQTNKPTTSVGGGENVGGMEADACPAPGRSIDGVCLEPGVADDGCPAGSAMLAGRCQPAGIAADGCGDGFMHDGEVSCEPLLPAEDCAVLGDMAVPGDSVCRPIMSCGSGTWGDIPVDGNTIYVDADYAVGDGDGSALKPYPTIGEALAAAQGGELIAIAEGGYIADLIINKPVTLHGVCPEQTEILGSPFEATAAIDIRAGGSGSSIIGVRVTDLHVSAGIEINGATDVTIDRVRVTNNIGRGIAVQRSGSQSSDVTIQDSLIDDNYEIGVFVWGSKVTVLRSQIRDTNEYGPNDLGFAVDVSHEGSVPSDATIRGSLIERSAFFGINVYGSSLLLEDSVVRATLSRQSDGAGGRGINAQFANVEQARPSLTVRRSVIDDNRDCGVFGASADVTIDQTVVRATHIGAQGTGTGVTMQTSTFAPSDDGGSVLALTASVIEANEGAGLFVSNAHASVERAVVRDTLPEADGTYGRGVYLRIDDEGTTPGASMDLVGSRIDNNSDVGLFVAGAELHMSGTIVSNTQPDDEGPGGRGISIQPQETLGVAADVSIDSSVVEGNSNHGIYLTGSTLVVRSSVVRDTAMDLLKSDGRGIGAQMFGITGAPSALTLEDSLVESSHGIGLFVSGSSLDMRHSAVRGTQPALAGGAGRGLSLQNLAAAQSSATISDSIISDNHEFGVFVIGSEVQIDGTIVSETASADGNGERIYGDGLVMLADAPGTLLTLSDSRIGDNERAGILYYSGDLVLADTALSCNAIDLVDGSQGTLSFDNAGGNACGCPGGADDCKWLSSSVTPPEALPPADSSGDDS